MLLLLALPISSSFHLSNSFLPHTSNPLLPPSSLSLSPSPVLFLRTALPCAATFPSAAPRHGRAIAWRAAADGAESSSPKKGGFLRNYTRTQVLAP